MQATCVARDTSVRKLSPSFDLAAHPPHVDVCAEKGTPITALGARLSRALAAKRQATA